MERHELPPPPHFDPERVDEIRQVPYQSIAEAAATWASDHGIAPASEDGTRIALLAVDVQNTFCTPGFELFVGGRSGRAAVDDVRRLCEFVYRHLDRLTTIVPTLDSHHAGQVFHPLFLVDAEGRHPEPYTFVSVEDVETGRWRFNADLAGGLGIDPDYGRRHLLHYVRSLRGGGHYDLTIWPYHAMVGGIGHALVAAFEEAVFFHAVARRTVPRHEIKGDDPLTEHYSVLGPEVSAGPDGRPLGRTDTGLVDRLLAHDAVIVAGEAKSHCVAWTVDDLLDRIGERDPGLARRVYLLEDCTSPVVVPGGADFGDAADAAFERFARAGVHVVRSTDPLDSWLEA